MPLRRDLSERETHTHISTLFCGSSEAVPQVELINSLQYFYHQMVDWRILQEDHMDCNWGAALGGGNPEIRTSANGMCI